MKLLSEKNVNDFLNKYKNLHDASYEKITYLVKNSEIRAILNAYDFSGEKPTPSKLALKFTGVKSNEINEVFDWNFLSRAIITKQDDIWVFMDDEKEPYISIACNGIYWE